MRPWMLRGLERERRKLIRQRRRQDEQRIALRPHANEAWNQYEEEAADAEALPVRRGIWITDL